MIYVTEEQHAFLREHADTTGRSIAQVVRDAVSLYRSQVQPGDDVYDFIGSVTGEGGADTAARDEEYLKEIFGDPGR